MKKVVFKAEYDKLLQDEAGRLVANHFYANQTRVVEHMIESGEIEESECYPESTPVKLKDGEINLIHHNEYEMLQDKILLMKDHLHYIAHNMEGLQELLEDAIDNYVNTTLWCCLQDLYELAVDCHDDLETIYSATGDVSPENTEVYEWWLISTMLAGWLKDKGEVVVHYAGNNWWGRQCSGQALYMDTVIQECAMRYGGMDDYELISENDLTNKEVQQ